jgi:hypothetical protein
MKDDAVAAQSVGELVVEADPPVRRPGRDAGQSVA